MILSRNARIDNRSERILLRRTRAPPPPIPPRAAAPIRDAAASAPHGQHAQVVALHLLQISLPHVTRFRPRKKLRGQGPAPQHSACLVIPCATRKTWAFPSLTNLFNILPRLCSVWREKAICLTYMTLCHALKLMLLCCTKSLLNAL